MIMTKSAARRQVQEAGYTTLYEVSSCGNYAHGSREYWSKPGSATNKFGRPLEVACISKLPGGWVVSK